MLGRSPKKECESCVQSENVTRNSFGIESEEDANRNRSEIIEYLSRKQAGEGDQGMYVGVDWLEEEGDAPFAIQISSYVSRPAVVSVKIVSSHL